MPQCLVTLLSAVLRHRSQIKSFTDCTACIDIFAVYAGRIQSLLSNPNTCFFACHACIWLCLCNPCTSCAASHDCKCCRLCKPCTDFSLCCGRRLYAARRCLGQTCESLWMQHACLGQTCENLWIHHVCLIDLCPVFVPRLL